MSTGNFFFKLKVSREEKIHQYMNTLPIGEPPGSVSSYKQLFSCERIEIREEQTA
jgi:hypothetical protein